MNVFDQTNAVGRGYSLKVSNTNQNYMFAIDYDNTLEDESKSI